MSRAAIVALSVCSWLVFAGCSGSTPSPKSGDDADSSSLDESSDSGDADGRAKAEKEKEERRRAEREDVDQPDLKKEPKAEPSEADIPEPKFVDGGSVTEAINAVPQGLPRENLEQEALDRPLLDPGLYQPCKAGPSQHFTIKFAVWDGRVVGTDITTTPKSDKFEECLREVVKRVKWPSGDRSRSLNISTVMF